MRRAAQSTILFLAFSSMMNAQQLNDKTFAIKKFAFAADTSGILIDSADFLLDSIYVSGKIYPDKIISSMLFVQSSTALKAGFYFRDGALVLVRIEEKSPLGNDMNRFTELYFENCQVFSERNYFSVRICMPFPAGEDWNTVYGYNKNLDGMLLKKIITQVLTKVRPGICPGRFLNNADL